MLCPVCNNVNRVIKQYDNTLELSCGHKRGTGLLPQKKGMVGLEQVLSGDKLAIKLFTSNKNERI